MVTKPSAGSKTPTVSALHAIRMALLHASQRQKILTQNMSNLNVPHYKAKDLPSLTFKKLVSASNRLSLKTTDSGHIEREGSHSMAFNAIKDPEAYETAPNGNNVVPEQQMQKIAATNTDFQMASNLYKKMMDFMKIATGG